MSSMITAELCPIIKILFVLILRNMVEKFLFLGLAPPALSEGSGPCLDSSALVTLSSGGQLSVIAGCLPLSLFAVIN